MINLDKAKEQAEKEMLRLFSQCNIELTPPYLADVYLEDKNCWMFFMREEDITIIPEGHKVLLNNAYVISKKGNGRNVVNLYHDLEEAKKYNKEMSDYFERINE